MVLGRFLRKQPTQDSSSVETDGLGGFGSVEDLNTTADPRAATAESKAVPQEDVAAVFKRRRKRPVAVQESDDSSSSSSKEEENGDDDDDDDENISIGESVDTEVDEDFQRAISDKKPTSSSGLSSHFDAANKKKRSTACAIGGESAGTSDDDLTVDTNAVKSMVANDLFGDFRGQITDEPSPDEKDNNNDDADGSSDSSDEPPPTSSWGRAWFGRKQQQQQQQPPQKDLEVSKEESTTNVENSSDDAAAAEESRKTDTSKREGGGWFARKKEDSVVVDTSDDVVESPADESIQENSDSDQSEIKCTSEAIDATAKQQQIAGENEEAPNAQPRRRLGWFNRRSESQASDDEPAEVKDDDSDASIEDDHSSQSNPNDERSATSDIIGSPRDDDSIHSASEDGVSTAERISDNDARSSDNSLDDKDDSRILDCSDDSHLDSISSPSENNDAVMEASEQLEKKPGMGWFRNKEEEYVDTGKQDPRMSEACIESSLDESSESVDSDAQLDEQASEPENVADSDELSERQDDVENTGESQVSTAAPKRRLGWFSRRSESEAEDEPTATDEPAAVNDTAAEEDDSSQRNCDEDSETSASIASPCSDSISSASQDDVSDNNSFSSSNDLEAEEAKSENVTDPNELTLSVGQDDVENNDESQASIAEPKRRLGWFNRRSDSQAEDEQTATDVPATVNDAAIEEDDSSQRNCDEDSETSASIASPGSDSISAASQDDVSDNNCFSSSNNWEVEEAKSENVTDPNELSVRQDDLKKNDGSQASIAESKRRLGWFNRRSDSQAEDEQTATDIPVTVNDAAIEEDDSSQRNCDEDSETSASIASPGSDSISAASQDNVSNNHSFSSSHHLEAEEAESENVADFEEHSVQQNAVENGENSEPIVQRKQRLGWFNRKSESHADDEPAEVSDAASDVSGEEDHSFSDASNDDSHSKASGFSRSPDSVSVNAASEDDVSVGRSSDCDDDGHSQASGFSRSADSVSVNAASEDYVSVGRSSDCDDQLEENVADFDGSGTPMARPQQRLGWFNRKSVSQAEDELSPKDGPAEVNDVGSDASVVEGHSSQSDSDDKRSDTSNVNDSSNLDYIHADSENDNSEGESSCTDPRPSNGSLLDNNESFNLDRDGAQHVERTAQGLARLTESETVDNVYTKNEPNGINIDSDASREGGERSSHQSFSDDERSENGRQSIDESPDISTEQETAQYEESQAPVPNKLGLQWFNRSKESQSEGTAPHTRAEMNGDDSAASSEGSHSIEDGHSTQSDSDCENSETSGVIGSREIHDASGDGISGSESSNRDSRLLDNSPMDNDESCDSGHSDYINGSPNPPPDESNDEQAKSSEQVDRTRGMGWFRSKEEYPVERDLYESEDESSEGRVSNHQAEAIHFETENSSFQKLTLHEDNRAPIPPAQSETWLTNEIRGDEGQDVGSFASSSGYSEPASNRSLEGVSEQNDLSVDESFTSGELSLQDSPDDNVSCSSDRSGTSKASCSNFSPNAIVSSDVPSREEQSSPELTSPPNVPVSRGNLPYEESEGENSGFGSMDSDSQSSGGASQSHDNPSRNDESFNSNFSAGLIQEAIEYSGNGSQDESSRDMSQDRIHYTGRNVEVVSDSEESQYSVADSDSKSYGDSVHLDDTCQSPITQDESSSEGNAVNTRVSQIQASHESDSDGESAPGLAKAVSDKVGKQNSRSKASSSDLNPSQEQSSPDSAADADDGDSSEATNEDSSDDNDTNANDDGNCDDKQQARKPPDNAAPSNEDDDIKRAMAMALAIKNNPNMTPAEIQQLVGGGQSAVLTTSKAQEKPQPRRRWGWFGGGKANNDTGGENAQIKQKEAGTSTSLNGKEPLEKASDKTIASAKPSNSTPSLNKSKISNQMNRKSEAKRSGVSESADTETKGRPPACRTISVSDHEEQFDGDDQALHDDDTSMPKDGGKISTKSSQSASASSSALSDDQSHVSDGDCTDDDFPNTESKDDSSSCSRKDDDIDDESNLRSSSNNSGDTHRDRPVTAPSRQLSSKRIGLDAKAKSPDHETDMADSTLQEEKKTKKRRSKDKNKNLTSNVSPNSEKGDTAPASPKQQPAEHYQKSEKILPIIPPRDYGKLAIARALIQRQSVDSDEDPVSSSDESEYESESDSDEDMDNGKKKPFRLVVKEAPMLRLENVTANTRSGLPEKDMRKKKAWGWGFRRKEGGRGEAEMDTDDEDDKKEIEETEEKTEFRFNASRESPAGTKVPAKPEELAVKSKKKTKKKKKKKKVDIGAHLGKSVRKVTRHGDEVSVGTMNFSKKNSNREVIISDQAPDFEVSEEGTRSHPWAKGKSARKGSRRFSASQNKSNLNSFIEEEEEDLKKIEAFGSAEEFFRESVTETKQSAKTSELASVVESKEESDAEDETNSDKDEQQSQTREEEETETRQEEEGEEDDALGHLLALTELEEKLSGDDLPGVDFDDMWEEASCDMSIVLEFERTKRKKNRDKEKKRQKRELEKEEKANAARRLRLFEKSKERHGNHDMKKGKNSKLSEEFMDAIHKVFDDGSVNSQDSVSDSNSDIDDAADDMSADGSAASLYLDKAVDENDESTELDDSQGHSEMGESTDDFEASGTLDHKSRASKSRRSKTSRHHGDSASKARSSKADSKRKKMKRSKRMEVDASDVFIAEVERLKKPKVLTIQGLRQEMVDRRGTSVNLLKKEYVTFKKKRKSAAEDELHQIDFETLGRGNGGGVNAVKQKDIFASPTKQQEEEPNEQKRAAEDGLGAMISRWATEEGITELDDLATVAAPRNTAPNPFGAAASTATNVAKTAATSTAAALKHTTTNQDLNDLARGASQGIKTVGGNVQSAGQNLGRNLNQAGRTAGRNIGSGISNGMSAVGSGVGVGQGFGSSSGGMGQSTKKSVGKPSSRRLQRNDSEDEMNMFTATFSEMPLSSIQEADDDEDDFGLLASHKRDDSEDDDDDNFSYSSARSKRSFTKSASAKFHLVGKMKAPKLGKKMKNLGLKMPSLPMGGPRGKNSNGFSLNENSSDFY